MTTRVPNEIAAGRKAPGGGRLTVDDDHPELIAFHWAGTDLTDALTDLSRRRDGLVRMFANAARFRQT